MAGVAALTSYLPDEHVTAVSLFLSERDLASEHSRMRARALHTLINPPDLLTRMRAKRTLDEIEFAKLAECNKDIATTSAVTDLALDVSGYDSAVTLSRILSFITRDSRM
jgi:hypothetical protein